jgi:hypothetical protein
MSIIKNVNFSIRKGRNLKILTDNICLRMPYSESEDDDWNKLVVGDNLEVNSLNFNYREFNYFDKSKLLEVQNILLNAYVFSYDKIDEALEDEASIDELNRLKNLVIAVRTHLRYVSKYLTEYEEMKQEIVKDL